MAAYKKPRYKFDLKELAPEITELKGQARSKKVKEVAKFLEEAVLQDMDRGISSVNGKKWKGLSKDYKAFKKSQGKGGKADLEFSSELKGAVKTIIKGTTIDFTTMGQRGKSEGLNQHSTTNDAPVRRFIPAKGQKWRPTIRKGMKKIVEE